MIKKTTAILICVILFISLMGCAPKKASSTEFALNTVITITAYGPEGNKAIEAAFAEIKRIEQLLSCHIDTSEVSLINKNASAAPVSVGGETAAILKKTVEMSKKTKGAFDISIKPLVNLWNINAENPVIPQKDEIDACNALVNYNDIIIRGNTVAFAKKGMQIDLGGAAKGYCADRAAEVLKSFGIKNAILDLGGNIYALGKNEQGKSWRIGLQDPAANRGRHFAIEDLSNKTAVTSGSYERYFEKDGIIYHHILNPQTGYPADSGLISVTVISDNSLEADMLSTAIFVMGRDEFEKVSDRFSYDKIITVDKYNQVRTYTK